MFAKKNIIILKLITSGLIFESQEFNIQNSNFVKIVC